MFERPDQALQTNHDSLLKTLKKPQVMALIAVCFLMQASHAPYYTFYSIYLENADYPRSVIGGMWALGVIAEVILLLCVASLVQNFGVKKLLVFSLLLTVIRWGMIAYGVQHLWILIIAQCLHAASFGLYHVCAINLFHKYFPGRIQSRGQAIYSSSSFGAGLALGSFICGYLWQGTGAIITFLSASILCVIALIICIVWINE